MNVVNMGPVNSALTLHKSKNTHNPKRDLTFTPAIIPKNCAMCMF